MKLHEAVDIWRKSNGVSLHVTTLGGDYCPIPHRCIKALEVLIEHAAANTSSGVELIAAERQRQVQKENWSLKHDDGHTDGELAVAAACYAANGTWARVVGEPTNSDSLEDAWPWDSYFCDKRKKHDRIRQLTIAGALIAAEIERLKRREE